MILTKEQTAFKESKNFSVEDSFTNLKNNYFQPVMEEEKKIVEEYEKSLFGKMGCGGAFAYGCLGPVILIPILYCLLSTIIPSFESSLALRSIRLALLFTIPEYFFIVWINNDDFMAKHKNKTPYHIKLIKDLLLPLTAIISQDQKDDSTISLSTNLVNIRDDKNKLSSQQMLDRNIKDKRGLSVYESNIMDLSATMADGTRINYNYHQILSKVYIYKKRGSKHKEKGKITLKAMFAVPSRVYKALPEGNINIGEFTANVGHGEKSQKILIKKVIEDTYCYPENICKTFIDMMATVYSVLEAN